MYHSRQKLFGTVAAAAIAGVFALAVPAAMAADAAAPAKQAAPAKTGADPVEVQIKRLHDNLHITDAQSAQFEAVAQIMRENRDTHDSMVEEKRKNEKDFSAAEDLNAYADIAQAHAEGVRKLATAFSTLYDSLSDDQKKAADKEFREQKKRFRHHEPEAQSQQPKSQPQ